MRTKAKVPVMLAWLAVLIVSSVFTVGCDNDISEAPATPTQVIDINIAEEAYALIQDNTDNEDFIIIDVRTPEEYADGHIEKAINRDYQSATFRDDIGTLDRNKTYFIYCRSGRRSAGAVEVMRELGFSKLYHLTGGILQWEEAGLPVVK